MVEYVLRSKRVLVAAGAMSLAIAGMAHAQTIASSAAPSNSGYRATTPQQLQTGDAARDSNGAPIQADGVTQAGEDQSDFTRNGADGAFDTLSGVGSSGALSGNDGDLAVVTRAGSPADAKPVAAKPDNTKDKSSGDASHVQ